MQKPYKFKSRFEEWISYQLEQAGIAYEYELETYTYTQTRRYTPDFFIPNGVIIEAKGKFTSDDRRKHLAIKQHYPELDIRFVFQRNNWLRKGSKTKYSDWAKKHDYEFSIGEVPRKWLRKKR